MLNSHRLLRRFSVAAVLVTLATSLSAVTTHAWDNSSNALNYATTNSWGAAITTDANGNTYQVVPFDGTWTTGNISVTAPTGDRWAIAKYNASGEPVWVSLPADASFPIAAIAVDASGNVYMSGDYHVTGNLGSTTLNAPASDWTDAWVGKMNSSGQMLWARSMNGTSYQGSAGVGVDASGNVYVSGGFQGTTTFGEVGSKTSAGSNDLFLAKLNSSGVFQWVTTAGSTGDDNLGWLQNLVVDSAGNSYVSGQMAGTVSVAGSTLTSQGGRDAFVAKVNSSGTWVWAANGGSTSSDNVYGIALDSSNNVFITGQVSGASVFGSYNATVSGSRDSFIAKLSSSGSWQWVRTFGGTGTDDSYAISVDPNGDPVVVGYFDSPNFQVGGTSVSFGGVADAFVVKYNSSGIFQWVRSIYGSNDDELYGVGTDSAGNIYTSGYITGPANITFGSGTSVNYGQSCSSSCSGVILWKLSPTGGVPSAVVTTTTSTIAATTTTTTIASNTTTSTVASNSGVTTGSTNSANATTRRTTTANTSVVTTVAEAMQNAETMPKAATANAPEAIEVKTGELTALINGKAVSTTVRREANQVILTVNNITVKIAAIDSDGNRIPLNSSGNLQFTGGDKIEISVSGVKADSDFNSWIFSDPTLLGTMSVTGSGTAEKIFDVPATIANGSHTLTFEATTPQGEAANLRYGVKVGEDSNSSIPVSQVFIAIIVIAILSALFLPAVIKRRKQPKVA